MSDVMHQISELTWQPGDPGEDQSAAIHMDTVYKVIVLLSSSVPNYF